jgi:hypothetical protein
LQGKLEEIFSPASNPWKLDVGGSSGVSRPGADLGAHTHFSEAPLGSWVADTASSGRNRPSLTFAVVAAKWRFLERFPRQVFSFPQDPSAVGL